MVGDTVLSRTHTRRLRTCSLYEVSVNAGAGINIRNRSIIGEHACQIQILGLDDIYSPAKPKASQRTHLKAVRQWLVSPCRACPKHAKSLLCLITIRKSSVWQDHSSSCPSLPYPPPASFLLSPLVLCAIRDIQPPRPSLCAGLSSGNCDLPFSPGPDGGLMSRPGMALSEVKLLGRRISNDGTGERALINDSTSACCAGVGMAVIASPKSWSMSSRRTLAVSG